MRDRKIFVHVLFGVGIPTILLLNAFVVPEPYSHPLIHLGLAPVKLMPFLENRELMGYLTELVFRRMTPNYAPIQILFLSMFWVLASIAASVFASALWRLRKSA
ncbi:hypothetical protein [Halioxenophilus sp. WMMB6]|uniref:hypothetical protein n=1 Tax=Halioxenophilus sp. WMMB6 TaxID=3073815 RepID=UPI00295E3624|nr:hypothetical protein [Halioxenophilus sp. WMMB6]